MLNPSSTFDIYYNQMYEGMTCDEREWRCTSTPSSEMEHSCCANLIQVGVDDTDQGKTLKPFLSPYTFHTDFSPQYRRSIIGKKKQATSRARRAALDFCRWTRSPLTPAAARFSSVPLATTTAIVFVIRERFALRKMWMAMGCVAT
jgi:hypothetical protein